MSILKEIQRLLYKIKKSENIVNSKFTIIYTDMKEFLESKLNWEAYFMKVNKIRLWNISQNLSVPKCKEIFKISCDLASMQSFWFGDHVSARVRSIYFLVIRTILRYFGLMFKFNVNDFIYFQNKLPPEPHKANKNFPEQKVLK